MSDMLQLMSHARALHMRTHAVLSLADQLGAARHPAGDVCAARGRASPPGEKLFIALMQMYAVTFALARRCACPAARSSPESLTSNP